jgi:hypothetical protein
MRRWYAVLANNPQDCIVIEQGALDDAALKRFDEAAASNKVRAIGVIGMWIIDHATEYGEIIRCHGRVDRQIRARYKAYLARRRRG